jgi:hypothetical protein
MIVEELLEFYLYQMMRLSKSGREHHIFIFRMAIKHVTIDVLITTPFNFTK